MNTTINTITATTTINVINTASLIDFYKSTEDGATFVGIIEAYSKGEMSYGEAYNGLVDVFQKVCGKDYTCARLAMVSVLGHKCVSFFDYLERYEREGIDGYLSVARYLIIFYKALRK